MGLLEKAFKYKDEINKRGSKTLIDRIIGPAETEFEKNEPVFVDLTENKGADNDILFLSRDELREIREEVPAVNESEIALPAGILVPEPEDSITAESIQESADLIAEEILKTEAIDTNADTSASRFILADEGQPVFDDYQILHETGMEILGAKSLTELTDVILFLVMGQMGSSSSSILLPDPDSPDKWVISDSRGIKAAKKDLFFDSQSGIINELQAGKRVIDIDQYSKLSEFSGDYIKFISIDTKIVVPLLYDDEITGILTLGEKISGEDYLREDTNYLETVGRAAAHALRGLAVKKWSYKDINLIDTEINRKRTADTLIKSFFAAQNISELKALADDFLLSNGFTSYAVYIKPEFEDKFIPALTASGDYSGRGKLFLDLSDESRMAKTIAAAGIDGPVTLINDPISAEIVNHDIISIIRALNIYPVKENEKLKGFICEITPNIRQTGAPDVRLIDMVKQPLAASFLNLQRVGVQNHFKAFDLLSMRIDKEIKRSKSLSIPLSLVMLSVKNYKRIFNIQGIDKTNQFFASLELLIGKRVSDDDFFLRYDRNKILIVLPGKDKKFAAALAGSLKSGLAPIWPDDESSPLAVVMVAQFPEDGENLFALLDMIE